ncbi:hypothetical protein J4G43_022750 [Bradyrhizobium barranii subsp. barranii]|uniref:Uncharacterized protein n=1 Tax=Bradyrhizobium barranii subsp. barranii TaxID=2823807 RepID=A0A939M6M5_9BRAD|nr:hypothetical protein [Bradyrhizobium barranii]UEM16784.1 hypothetical protein J4G43_022750 [Bradyrhizobium barranii subsp. barranii]
MGELTFANVAQKYELVTCAGEVRFRQAKPDEVGPLQILQQRFEVVEYEDGKIVECRQDWRDVPTVSNGTRG